MIYLTEYTDMDTGNKMAGPQILCDTWHEAEETVYVMVKAGIWYPGLQVVGVLVDQHTV